MLDLCGRGLRSLFTPCIVKPVLLGEFSSLFLIHNVQGNLASMALDPSDGGVRGSKLIVGRTTGVISVFDLRTSQYLNRVRLLRPLALVFLFLHHTIQFYMYSSDNLFLKVAV